ncbi:MAG TPA: heat-inducible transcriptional repressor HrcA [Terriglobia bacterium]|nr:heat-inducible transcriptional repressor HrcA [Terriglobia bacterium]
MTHRDAHGELVGRTGEILRLLVRMHIASCDPVGSRTLSKSIAGKLSPATIRNIMADLEEGGYLVQPHTSAGRVPSDKGYRFYVDTLNDATRLSRADERMVDQLFGGSDTPEEIMASASRLLSTVSGNVGIVTAPPLASTQMKHIEFMNLGDNRVLVIFVSRSGLLQKKVIRLQEGYSQEELNRAGRMLVDRFTDKTLTEIRSELVRLMEEERQLYDRMLHLLGAWKSTLDEEIEPAVSEVYVQGATNIVHQPEFADIERMRALFEMFEEKGRLVRILNACIAADPAGAVKIAIGSELGAPSMRAFTAIVTTYAARDNTIGFLGIIGPTRMEYERGISIVGHLGRLMTQRINA